jgi:hypothetical protein
MRPYTVNSSAANDAGCCVSQDRHRTGRCQNPEKRDRARQPDIGGEHMRPVERPRANAKVSAPM